MKLTDNLYFYPEKGTGETIGSLAKDLVKGMVE